MHPYKWSTIKDQKSNYGIPLHLQKTSSEVREDFVSYPQLNMIDNSVTMDLQKKYLIESAENCPH